MWSGPRNLSTVMMYAYGNRADFRVLDAPFYGPYLRSTGLNHPMRAAILASRPEPADDVARGLLAPVPADRRLRSHWPSCPIIKGWRHSAWGES